MCRFLLVRSKEKIKPQKLLNQFADMCEVSLDTDGDPQKDGWGVAVKSEKLKVKSKKWEIYKSLNPIWEEKEKFSEFPDTNMFIVHVRSASFPNQKGVLEYNQPYINGQLCFVFNGRMYGVRITRPLAGDIGAQKIFSLIQEEFLKNNDLKQTLSQVNNLIMLNSKRVQGINIGVIYNNIFYLLCQYNEYSQYFTIHYYQDSSLTLVCSEPIGNYRWEKMEKGEIQVL